MTGPNQEKTTILLLMPFTATRRPPPLHSVLEHVRDMTKEDLEVMETLHKGGGSSDQREDCSECCGCVSFGSAIEISIDNDDLFVKKDEHQPSMGGVETIEAPVHHLAHWVMLWSQSSYLGQVLFTLSQQQGSTSHSVTVELLLTFGGIIFLSMGILASGLAVVLEIPALRRLVGFQYRSTHPNTQSSCLLLVGASSCGFSLLQLLSLAGIVYRQLDCTSNGSALMTFRVIALCWGCVSTLLWFSFHQRLRRDTEIHDDEAICCSSTM